MKTPLPCEVVFLHVICLNFLDDNFSFRNDDCFLVGLYDEFIILVFVSFDIDRRSKVDIYSTIFNGDFLKER